MAKKAKAEENDPEKRERATLAQKIKILDWHHSHGKSQTGTAKHFTLKYPNLNLQQWKIHDWLKSEANWQAEYDEAVEAGVCTDNKQTRQTHHPEVTDMTDLWVSKAMADDILLTGGVLHQKWIQFADLAGIPEAERWRLRG